MKSQASFSGVYAHENLLLDTTTVVFQKKKLCYEKCVAYISQKSVGIEKTKKKFNVDCAVDTKQNTHITCSTMLSFSLFDLTQVVHIMPLVLFLAIQ